MHASFGALKIDKTRAFPRPGPRKHRKTRGFPQPGARKHRKTFYQFLARQQIHMWLNFMRLFVFIALVVCFLTNFMICVVCMYIFFMFFSYLGVKALNSCFLNIFNIFFVKMPWDPKCQS